jgi:hypothetical protein
MQIRTAPEKLSNTKLSTSDKIIKELKKDNSWPIELVPQSIYRKLATHDIFTEFAESNQVLCEQLRPFFLTDTKKSFSKTQLKTKIDSLQGDGKLFYNSPTDNNLLEYLANALIYKAFLMDAQDQIPQDEVNKYKQKIPSENLEKLEKQQKKVDECLNNRDEKKRELVNAEQEVKNLDKSHEEYEAECRELEIEYKKICGQELYDKDCANIYNEVEVLCKELKKDFETLESNKSDPNEDVDPDEYEKTENCLKNAKQYNEARRKLEKYEKIDALKKDLSNANSELDKARKDYKNLEGYEDFIKCAAHIRDYKKLDYKVSVHIRFTRTMNALNAYTEENFNTENLRTYGKPNQETGVADEYGWRILKRLNIMKLERGKINRYVTVQNGGIYTSLVGRSKVTNKLKNERTKFNFKNKTTTKDRDAEPIWDFQNSTDDYTLEQRIKDSCDNFNKKIEYHIISTYANYYCANNVLKKKGSGENTRLYLNYVYNPEGKTKKLEVPCSIEDEKMEQEALLHVMTQSYGGGKTYDLSSDDGFTYKQIKIVNRPQVDMIGFLYAIRKNEIAVSPMENGFHSSMWSGKKVQAAGVLAAWNGKLIAVDNQSGHYQPNWYLLYMAWKPFYENEHNIFHKKAIVGIAVPIGDKAYNQFFGVNEFMDLAKKDFEIGATVKEVSKYIKNLDSIRPPNGKGFKLTDQSQFLECNDVLTTVHLYRYTYQVWPDEKLVKDISRHFIDMLNYNWDVILPGFENAYKLFLGKKILFWRAKKIESVFKDRSTKLKAAINKIKNPDQLQKEEKEKYDVLTTAKEHYKEIFSKIKIKPDLTNEEKFELIESAADIYYANEAYSELVEKVPDDLSIKKCQDKIDAWANLIEPPLKAKADRRVGLDIEAWKTYLPGPLLSNEGENYPGKRDEDDLGNAVDVTSEIEPVAKAKLLHLVDTSSIPKTPSAQTPQIQPTAQPQQQKKPPPVPNKGNRPPSKKTPTQSTAQPQQPKQPPPEEQQQQPKKTQQTVGCRLCNCSAYAENKWKPGYCQCQHYREDHNG